MRPSNQILPSQNGETMLPKIYYYCIAAVQLKNKVLSTIATPKTVATLSIVSELINPFKMTSPEVYACKVIIDTIKETGKMALLSC